VLQKSALGETQTVWTYLFKDGGESLLRTLADESKLFMRVWDFATLNRDTPFNSLDKKKKTWLIEMKHQLDIKAGRD
jgi:hypothetical protein